MRVLLIGIFRDFWRRFCEVFRALTSRLRQSRRSGTKCWNEISLFLSPNNRVTDRTKMVSHYTTPCVRRVASPFGQKHWTGRVVSETNQTRLSFFISRFPLGRCRDLRMCVRRIRCAHDVTRFPVNVWRAQNRTCQRFDVWKRRAWKNSEIIRVIFIRFYRDDAA